MKYVDLFTSNKKIIDETCDKKNLSVPLSYVNGQEFNGGQYESSKNFSVYLFFICLDL